MATAAAPSIYDVQQRTPMSGWQTIDVQFNAANVDTVIPHDLDSDSVRFVVVDANVAGFVFRGTKAPTTSYIVLQASAVGRYRLQLHVEVTQGTTTLISGPTAGSTGSGSIPAGFYGPYAGGTVPTGWLLCDGASYLRADYPNLFAAIGVTYGAADGTHFNVPNLQRKVPVGSGGAGTAVLGNALGNVGGAETYALAVADLPSHAHPGSTVTITDPGHYHGIPVTTRTAGSFFGLDSGAVPKPYNGTFTMHGTDILFTNGTTAGTAPQTAVVTGITATNNVAAQGGGGAHTNMQPSIIANYIIKT